MSDRAADPKLSPGTAAGDNRPSDSSAGAATYLPFIEGLRGLLAVYVVLHHIYTVAGLFTPTHNIPRSLQNWLLWLYQGPAAVVAFIFISGLCLGFPVVRNFEAGINPLRHGVRHFYIARARRILPAYYGILAIGLVISQSLDTPTIIQLNGLLFPVTRQALIGSLLMVPNLVDSQNGVGTIWSLGVEMQIYLIFPLLCCLWKRFGILSVLAIVLTLATASGLYLPKQIGVLQLLGGPAVGLQPTYYVVFVMGMATAVLISGTQAIPVAIRARVPWGMLLLLACGAFYFLGFMREYRNGPRDYLIALIALLFVMTAYRRNGLKRVLSHPILYRLGTFSYSLYLIHLIVILLVNVLVFEAFWPPGEQDNFVKAFLFELAVGLPLSIGLAALFARVLEWPFMSGRLRRRMAPSARSAVVDA